MNTRKEKSKEKYRQKLHDLGVDVHFEYVEFVSKGHHRIRCKKCGMILKRSDDLFKGKTQTFKCRYCKNGTKAFSDFANEVLEFYQNGHSQRETMEKFGVSRNDLQDWAKRRGVTNGRTISEINREKAAVGAAKIIAKTGVKFKQKMFEQGFDVINEYRGKDTKVTLRCQKCGEQFERTIHHLTHKGARCPFCLEEERKARLQEICEKRLAEKKERNAIRKAEWELRRKEAEAKRNFRLDELHVCKVCGGSYSIRSYMESIGTTYERDSGFCSKKCRSENQRLLQKKRKKRSHGNHYHRAKKLGLPVDKGVTLPKLYKRDNGICQICGMVCVYSGDGRKEQLYPSIDHIIPMNNDPLKQGGHTWKNDQLAHRICNSNKRDYVGKEWHNGAC